MHEAGQQKLVLRDNPEGWGGEGGGGGFGMAGGTQAYLGPIHVGVRRKPSQYHRVIILQLK